MKIKTLILLFCFTLNWQLVVSQIAVGGYPGWYHYDMESSEIPEEIIKYVEESEDGSLWIGTAWEGLAHLEESGWTFYTTDNAPIGDNTCRAMVVENVVSEHENVWTVPLGDKGVRRFSNGVWTKYRTTDSNLAHNRLSHLILGADGKIWVNRYNTYQYYIPELDDWSNPISYPNSSLVDEFAVDETGRLWINHDDEPIHIFDYELGTITSFLDDQPEIDGTWTPLMDFRNDTMLMSQRGSFADPENDDIKTWFFDGEEWSMWTTDNSDISGMGLGLETTSDGVWMKCSHGLVLWTGTEFVVWDDQNSPLHYNMITDVAIDKFRRVWISTNYTGIYMLDLDEYDSQNVAIEDTKRSNVSVFPVPATGELNVVVDLEFIGGSIELYDTFGRHLSNHQISDVKNVLRPEKTGTYLIKVQSSSGRTFVKTVVVN